MSQTDPELDPAGLEPDELPEEVETATVEGDLEAPEADAAEQGADLVEAAPLPLRDLPLEANDADADEQRYPVHLDEDEYR